MEATIELTIEIEARKQSWFISRAMWQFAVTLTS